MSGPIELDDSLAETFISSFDDLNVFPENFTALIPTYLNPSKISEDHRKQILAKCTTILDADQDCSSPVDFPLWYRCTTVWFALTGEKHSSVKTLDESLIVSEVNIADYLIPPDGQCQQLDFDGLESSLPKTSLSNLILEEVEVTHFLKEK